MEQFSAKIRMTRLKMGEEEAFRLIYEKYWSRLYQICFYYTHSREDSEDMLMGIFMSLWNNRERADIENPEAYLVKAAKNQSFKYILREQRLKQQLRTLDEAPALADGYDSPLRALELKEMELQLQHQVESLPEKTKKIFRLSREKGLTYAEIAGYLGISVKTVEYHISKAISILSKSIALMILGFLFL